MTPISVAEYLFSCILLKPFLIEKFSISDKNNAYEIRLIVSPSYTPFVIFHLSVITLLVLKTIFILLYRSRIILMI